MASAKIVPFHKYLLFWKIRDSADYSGNFYTGTNDQIAN